MSIADYIAENHANIVKKCRPLLRTSVEEVEDSLHNVLVKVLRLSPNVAPAKYASFVTTSVMNDYFKRMERVYYRDRRDLHAEMTTNLTPEAELMNKQFNKAVIEQGQKSGIYNKIFNMRFVEDMDNEEIAKKLKISTELVRNHIKVNKKLGKFNHIVQDHHYVIPRLEVGYGEIEDGE